MSHPDSPTIEEPLNPAIAAGISQAAAQQWMLLQRHLEFGSGFALMLMSVPDEEAAAVCRRELSMLLGAQRRFMVRQADQPVFIYRLSDELAQVKLAPDTGVIWVESMPLHGSGLGATAEQRELEWRDAWQHVAARLNERRELLQQQIQGTLILVGPPELETLIREYAPDLWSVRVLQLQLERTQPKQSKPKPVHPEAEGEWRTALVSGPVARQLRQLLKTAGVVPVLPAALSARGQSCDPELGRIEASRLRQLSGRGVRQKEIEALLDAACGFLVRQELVEAERVAREAWGRIQVPELTTVEEKWRTQNTIESLGITSWSQILKGDHAGALNSAELAVRSTSSTAARLLGEQPVRRALYVAYGAMQYAAQMCELPLQAARAEASLSELADASAEPRAMLAQQALWRAQRGLLNGEDLKVAERNLRLALNDEKALPLGPRARALFFLSACLVQRGRLREAERMAQRGLLLLESAWPNGVDPDEGPIHGVILILLARALTKQSLVGAESVLRSALDMLKRRGAHWKEYQEPNLLLGMVLMLRGQYAAAEQQMQTVIDAQREHSLPLSECSQAVEFLASSLFIQGRWDDAERFLLKACADLREEGEDKLRSQIERYLRYIQRLRPRWFFAPVLGAVGRLKGWQWRRQMHHEVTR